MVLINDIKERLKKEEASPLGVYELYSVFIPLIKVEKRWQIIFEVRAEHLSTQPGEISFPGGAVEKGESRREAAIRETREELGVESDDLELLGEMDFLVTPYNLLIYSYVGHIRLNTLQEIDFNSGEVEEIFAVPVDYILSASPEKYNVKVESQPEEGFPYHLIPHGREYDWRQGSYPVYFYQYEGYIIWGFTARLLKALAELMKE